MFHEGHTASTRRLETLAQLANDRQGDVAAWAGAAGQDHTLGLFSGADMGTAHDLGLYLARKHLHLAHATAAAAAPHRDALFAQRDHAQQQAFVLAAGVVFAAVLDANLVFQASALWCARGYRALARMLPGFTQRGQYL